MSPYLNGVFICLNVLIWVEVAYIDIHAVVCAFGLSQFRFSDKFLHVKLPVDCLLTHELFFRREELPLPTEGRLIL